MKIQAKPAEYYHRLWRWFFKINKKRWYDLRRLKTAEDKLNGTLHAMLIEKANDKWVHKVVL